MPILFKLIKMGKSPIQLTEIIEGSQFCPDIIITNQHNKMYMTELLVLNQISKRKQNRQNIDTLKICMVKKNFKEAI